MAKIEDVCQNCGLANDARLLVCEFCGKSLESSVDVTEQLLVIDFASSSATKSVINLGNFLVLGFFIFLVVAVFWPGRNFSGSRQRARLKGCMANMRVLQGSVEMYNMDNQTMLHSFGEQELELLISGKYLRMRPVCPGQPPGYYFSSGDLLKEGVITCSVHGSADNPVED